MEGRLVTGHDAGADVRHTQEQRPTPCRQVSRKVGRRGVRLGNGKACRVAAAPSPKSSRVLQAEIDRSPLGRTILAEGDGHTGHMLGHIERHLHIGVEVAVRDLAGKVDVRRWRRQCLFTGSQAGDEPRQQTGQGGDHELTHPFIS